MPHQRLEPLLAAEVADLRTAGVAKGSEAVIVGVEAAGDGFGPRYLLDGWPGRRFLRMNSNGYLGLARHPAVVEAEERATGLFGAGPGAVRFISGTYQAHVDLERRLAAFHDRPAAMIYSSAYSTVLSALVSLITPDTVVLSDELNHNCIINALRLARPASREVYPHLDYQTLDVLLGRPVGMKRAIVVTDGVFSMRGDFADLSILMDIAKRHDDRFEENVMVIVDDSHGVGALGSRGRGTEEVTGGEPVDLLIGTLGKALGVNGGYLAGSQGVVDYLREKAPMYIYSNPITVGEAAAATAAIDVVDSDEGRSLLAHLTAMTAKFEAGLVGLGFETIAGPHPVVPLMVRDTDRTTDLVRHLFDNGVLATGLNYPVVPKGDEEIRFQVTAEHSEADIDHVLDVLGTFGA